MSVTAPQSFEDRVQRGEQVEPTEDLPLEYREAAQRMIQFHANSEIVGTLPERRWIKQAPTMRRKRAISAKVQDEAGHAQVLYRVAETLGLNSRDEMVEELIEGEAKYANVFNYEAKTWGDAGYIACFIDGAAMFRQGSLTASSYAPYARGLRKICYEESFHVKHGEDIIRSLATGSKAEQELLQDAVDRWWEPTLQFFGPRDADSTHQDELMRWGLKVKTNDELRQEFLEEFYVPKLERYGIEIPDDDLHYDEEAGRWEYTPLDWDRFFEVSRGDGPMNDERLSVRREAYEDNAWVRRAAGVN
ncbi:1,2-phenylacetyl-CoA epoxidase subunit PaaA [Natronobeatus ordinarius]|uniref:1,2-phenylacetyl-CoA epoxidase subunit PaaA n=1 Tax=Natronobeatus ordinarius TaxID=2963433 RepID=UPI0020CDA9C4|nr:1,2-phenylacetyl-CoA epoxidase subunit PaaA [Natronobeatus ordinarius]